MRRFHYILSFVIICIGIFFIANKVKSAPLANNLAWCTVNSGTINISHQECQSLAYLYEETDGDNWNNADWWFTDTDVSAWKGGNGTSGVSAIGISGGHIITITLQGNVLNGNIYSGFSGLPYLSGLHLLHNNVMYANLSWLSSLRSFNIGINAWFSWDLSYVSGLKYLSVYYNYLSSEKLMEMMAPLHQIEHLMAWSNLLTGALDFSAWPTLKILELNQSLVTSVNVSNNTWLINLQLNYNNLGYLDLSQNSALIYFAAQHNNLTGIDFNNPLATEVYLNFNDLASVDLSGLTWLLAINLSDNQLTSVDPSHNTRLNYLDLSNNDFTYLQITGGWASNLTALIVRGNYLTGIDISNAPALNNLNLSSQQWSGLTVLDISNNLNLWYLYASESNIETIITAPLWSYAWAAVFDFSNNPLSNVTDPNALTFLASFNQYTSVNALTWTAHDTAITLEWERPTDFGYSGDLYRYTVSLDTWAVNILTGAATSSYLVTGLTNTHTYTVSLCAVYSTTGADVSMCDHLSITPEESYCDPGREVSTGGYYPECVPCEAGTFNGLLNSQCIPAPAWYYIDTVWATGAIKCSPGSYSQSGGAISCTWASPGTFVAYEGSTGASLCEPGTYRGTTGAMTCLRTDEWYYVSWYGASFQTPCEANTYTDVQQSTSCLPCPTGYISNAWAITCVQIPVIGGGGWGWSSFPGLINPIKTIPSLTNLTSTKKNPKTTIDIYKWAFSQGITTLPLTKARLNDKIQRYEAAKMIVNFVKNIEKKPIVHSTGCDISLFSDSQSFDVEMKMYLTSICDLGLMGWSTPKSKGLIPLFRPFDTLWVEEFNIIINRYLNSSTTDIAKSNKRIDIMRFLMEQSTN